MDFDGTILDHEKRLVKVEDCQDDLKDKVNQLMGKASTTLILVKWVITPLILMLGGLVGIKLAL